MQKKLIIKPIHRTMALGLSAVLLTQAIIFQGVAVGQNQKGPSRPVRIAALTDKSYSTVVNGVPQMSSADLEPLIQLILARGGELAIGAVHAISTSPLVRLHVSTPPVAPVDSSQFESNVFLIRRAKSRFAQQSKIYEESFNLWRRQAVEDIASIRPQLDSLLRQPVADSASDVSNALKRLDTYLAESDAEWGASTMNFAILCTDGEHTTSKVDSFEFRSGAVLIVVPGGHLGIIASLRPFVFENLPSAVRFVLKRAEATNSIANQPSTR